MKVFVSDAHSRATLQIVRSLGSKGIEVYSGETFKITPTYYSKYLSGYLIYKDPSKDPKGFVRQLNNFCIKNDINIIIPVVDHVYNALGKYRNLLSPDIILPISEYNKFLMARDKLSTVRICEKIGVPVPKTYFEKKLDIMYIKNKFDLPIVIKPRKSSGSRGIKLINRWGKLKEEFIKISRKYGIPMIQEFIPHGGAYGVGVLYNQGKMQLSFTYKRLREFPEGGGPSTLRVAIHRADIEQLAKKIMDYLQWHGVAMVEFRVNKETGVPYLMEINPRYWGSLRLAIASGLDIPYAHYQMALGKKITVKNTYKEGTLARWLLFGDIMWFLTARNRNKVKEFFKPHKNIHYDILSLSDPLPAVGSLLEAILFFLNRGRREYAMARGLYVSKQK